LTGAARGVCCASTGTRGWGRSPQARDVDAAVAGGSSKTRELGQVLRSVENLLDRVRTSRAARQGVKLRQASGDSSGDKGPGSDDGPSRPAGSVLAEEALKAELRLREVSESLLDCMAVVDEWAAWEEKRLREIRERAEGDEAKYL